MIGIERAATGVPFAKVPEGQLGTGNEDVMKEALENFVSHENNYIMAPREWIVESLKIAHDAEKVAAAIDQENVGMAKSFLANFMELGLGGSSGSWALSRLS